MNSLVSGDKIKGKLTHLSLPHQNLVKTSICAATPIVAPKSDENNLFKMQRGCEHNITVHLCTQYCILDIYIYIVSVLFKVAIVSNSPQLHFTDWLNWKS